VRIADWNCGLEIWSISSTKRMGILLVPLVSCKRTGLRCRTCRRDASNSSPRNQSQSYPRPRRQPYGRRIGSGGFEVIFSCPRLPYSTYIGGNGQDNGTCIAWTPVAMLTSLASPIRLTFREKFVAATKSGNFNAFVVKLDSAGSILNSTLFGGSVGEFGSSIAVDSAGNIYVAGIATSRIFDD